jgi:hypothetical protein
VNPRQRIRLHRSWLTVAGQLVAALAGVALIWGALVVGGLTAGIAPRDVDSATGYRSVRDAVTGVTDHDVEDATVRLAVGLGGLALAVAFAAMARAQLPRPRLARGSVQVGAQQRGSTTVAPRAVERAVEGAAIRHPSVEAATGRYGADEMALDVTLGKPGDAAGALRAVRDAARESLRDHGLPETPVHVTLTKHDPTAGREVRP